MYSYVSCTSCTYTTLFHLDLPTKNNRRFVLPEKISILKSCFRWIEYARFCPCPNTIFLTRSTEDLSSPIREVRFPRLVERSLDSKNEMAWSYGKMCWIGSSWGLKVWMWREMTEWKTWFISGVSRVKGSRALTLSWGLWRKRKVSFRM